MAIAAGFVEREGRHLYDSLAFCAPDGDVHIYRKRNLVFWERFRFHPGPSAAGRVDAMGTGRLRDLRRHDLSQGLGRLSGSDRPGRGLGRLARLRRSRFGPPALAVRPRRPALGRDSGQGRDGSRHPGRFSPTSVVRPARRSPCWARGSATGSPARAASATAVMASRCVPAKSRR